MSAEEKIVTKILLQNISLQKMYQMLDSDGDGVLTMQEIRDTMPSLSLDID